MKTKNPLLVPCPAYGIPSKRHKKIKEIVYMKINFGLEIIGVDSKPVEDEDKKPLILKKVCITALLGNVPGDNISGEEKYKRYKLFRRIDDGVDGFTEVSDEEVTLLKTLIGKFYLPLVVGRAYDLFESQKNG